MFMIYLVLIFLKYYSYTCIICWLSVNLEHQVPSSIRLPRKQGGNATKATDMLKAILNPVVSCQYNDRYEQVTLPLRLMRLTVTCQPSCLSCRHSEQRLEPPQICVRKCVTWHANSRRFVRKSASYVDSRHARKMKWVHSLTSSRGVLGDSEEFPPLPAVSRPSDGVNADDHTLCPRKNYNPRQCKIEMSNLNAS